LLVAGAVVADELELVVAGVVVAPDENGVVVAGCPRVDV
jgi:hypothetical protein